MEHETHALLSASKAHRWRRCPASALAEASVPDSTSDYAAEGTAAHTIASESLKACLLKADRERWRTEWVNRIRATEEMLDAVDVYLDWANQHIEDGDTVLVEHKVSLEPNPGFPASLKGLMFGTADFARFRPRDKSLIVADYKHGAGVAVDVEGNDQLQYYALGVLLSLMATCHIEQVALVVVQPRARGDAIKQTTISAVDLLDWGQSLMDEALVAMSPEATFVPGEHCQFCSYAGQCSAVRNKALTVAKVPELGPLLPDSLTLEEIGALLTKAQEMETALQAWVAPFRAFANLRLSLGDSIPGWALVPKRAQRVWAEGAEETLVDVFGPDAFKPKELISVAQAEKLVGGKVKFKESPLPELVVSQSGGYNMVPVADGGAEIVKRGAVVPLLGPLDLGD